MKLSWNYLVWHQRKSKFNKKTHQTIGVENEFIPISISISETKSSSMQKPMSKSSIEISAKPSCWNMQVIQYCRTRFDCQYEMFAIFASESKWQKFAPFLCHKHSFTYFITYFQISKDILLRTHPLCLHLQTYPAAEQYWFYGTLSKLQEPG